MRIAPRHKDHLCAWTGMAQAYVHLGEDRRVEEIVERILQNYRPEEKCGYSIFVIGEEYFVKAEEAYQVGNRPQAEELYNKAAAIWENNRRIPEDPKHQALATYYTGRIYQTLRNLPKAIELYRETKEKWPTFEKIQWVETALAWCYRQLGQDREATVLYNQSVLRDPHSAAAFRENPSFLSADSYCGAYAVWHLLRHYGNPVPIETLIEQMGIRQKGYSTLQDISDVCSLYGISVQAMQIPVETVSDLKQPFVLYWLPTNGQDLGHFVLCIPQEEKGLILDGPKEPRQVDLSTLSEGKEGIWDGTILLIQTPRLDYLEKLVSERTSWQTAVQAAYVWFVKEDADISEDIEKISAYYQELSRQQMKTVKGGCPANKCKTQDSGCFTFIPCQTKYQCISGYICDDQTLEELCVPGGFLKCYYDIAHTCAPKRRILQQCVGVENRICLVDVTISYGQCGGKFVRDCYISPF